MRGRPALQGGSPLLPNQNSENFKEHNLVSIDNCPAKVYNIIILTNIQHRRKRRIWKIRRNSI